MTENIDKLEIIMRDCAKLKWYDLAADIQKCVAKLREKINNQYTDEIIKNIL